MTYKMVFLDIDGTILPPNHVIATSTKEAVKALQEKGILVSIATGRPLLDTVHVAKELGIENYITFNGGLATLKGTELFNLPYSDKKKNFIYSNVEFWGHELVISDKDGSYIVSSQNERMTDYLSGLELALEVEGGLKGREQQVKEKSILGSTIILNERREKDIYESNFNIQLVESNVGTQLAYDITSTDIHKASAIQRVIDHLGIKPEEVVAFGDGMNDKEMLSFVGQGVAMGNANPLLHQHANFVTSSVEEDGIWKGLKTLGLI